MGDENDGDAPVVDDYDEEADSDFNAESIDEERIASSSDGDDSDIATEGPQHANKRRKVVKALRTADDKGEWDSGDEATLKEYKRERRRREKEKQKQTEKAGEDQDVEEDSDDVDQGWRARTRGMRQSQKEEQKKKKLASVKGSTIDVEKLWEEMNRPGRQATSPSRDEAGANITPNTLIAPIPQPAEELSSRTNAKHNHTQQEPGAFDMEEMVTIRIPQSFAGKTTYTEKTVSKSSAEAQEFYSQRSHRVSADGQPLRRPLRKISRFDPNNTNLDNFKRSWQPSENQKENVKAKKITVVEKSGQDWVAHKDAAGLQEELDKAAKSKADYHGRIEFLNRTELATTDLS